MNLAVGHRRQGCQNIFDVFVGIDAAVPAIGDDQINHRTPPPCVFAPDEQPVLLADGCGPNGVLAKVVVAFDSTVVEEARQHWPLAEGVVKRFAHETSRQVGSALLEDMQAAPDAFDDRAALAPPHGLPQPGAARLSIRSSHIGRLIFRWSRCSDLNICICASRYP